MIEKGTFSAYIDNKVANRMGDGTTIKSFGELALIYDIRRQATVKAETSGTLFVLDRDTYRYTIANSYEKRSQDIMDALLKVPLLKNLTPAQMEKLVEAVELTTYEEGTCLTRYRYCYHHIYASLPIYYFIEFGS